MDMVRGRHNSIHNTLQSRRGEGGKGEVQTKRGRGQDWKAPNNKKTAVEMASRYVRTGCSPPGRQHSLSLRASL